VRCGKEQAWRHLYRPRQQRAMVGASEDQTRAGCRLTGWRHLLVNFTKSMKINQKFLPFSNDTGSELG
jgi:hypothetical protein